MAFSEETLKEIVEGPELKIYLAIDSIARHVALMRTEMHRGNVPEGDIPAILSDIAVQGKQQRSLIMSTMRFGVDHPYNGRFVSGQFESWMKWWNQYVRGLSPIEANRMRQDIEDKADISAWRPSGSWKEI